MLDSQAGTHAAGIRVQCIRRDSAGASQVLFDKHADDQGRISERVEVLNVNEPMDYELVFHSKAYFQNIEFQENAWQILPVVVIRLTLPDAAGNYHIPMMLSPHSYSVWWSAPTPSNS